MKIVLALIFTLLSSVASAQVTWQNDRGATPVSPALAGPTSGTASGTKSWSASIPLSPGQNNITITATDGGSVATDTHIEFYIPTFPGNALVLALGFEGNGTDSTGIGNTANPINGATYTANGKFGQGLLLNGTNQYAEVQDHATLDFTQSFTISAWINPVTSTAIWRTVAAKNYTFYLYSSIEGYCGSAGILGGVWVNGSLGAFDQETVCNATPIPTNTMTHLAVTYNGLAASNNLCLYKAGVLLSCDSLASVPGIMEPSDLTLTIGADRYNGCALPGGVCDFFQGIIDEVRFYNFAIPIGTATPGAACTYSNYTAQVITTPALATVRDDMNCPVVPTGPPLTIKFPASATGLTVGASATGLKFGQP